MYDYYLLVYVCFVLYMHAYDRSLVNITPPIPSLVKVKVSLNSSSDDLNESLYYMLIFMQHNHILVF